MSTPAWARKLVPAIRTIDGGCDSCIRDFIRQLTATFPTIPWDELVWLPCPDCGASCESVRETRCEACYAAYRKAHPHTAPPANLGQIVAVAWEQAIGPERTDIFGAYDTLERTRR